MMHIKRQNGNNIDKSDKHWEEAVIQLMSVITLQRWGATFTSELPRNQDGKCRVVDYFIKEINSFQEWKDTFLLKF